MNTKLLFTAVITGACCFLAAPLRAEDKTATEKTSEAWDATKKTTKEVADKVVQKTKETANQVEDAIEKPDADAHKVDVKVTDSGVQMPSALPAGKTAFIVKNTGKQAHNFEIEGSGLDKSFWFNVAPGATKNMQVDLKPGTYEADCKLKGAAGKETKVKLTVK